MTEADVLSELDLVLSKADTTTSPWEGSTSHDDKDARVYQPDLETLESLLAIPVEQGRAERQQSGRLARSLDAYVAHELRRAGFSESSVFPRPRLPRVLPAELAPVEERVHALISSLTTYEKHGKRLTPSAIRKEVVKLRDSLPGSADANILGRFYVKQVDVVVSDWRRGPEILVSGKSMVNSYRKNLTNRYEEAVGEAYNLRDRYPLAAMGYAYVARSSIFDEAGAFEMLRDLLVRLRRPDGPFNATMLLIAKWDGAPSRLIDVRDDIASTLTASRFFEDLVGAVLENTPVAIHKEVRLRREGEPPGGMPPKQS